MTVAYWSREVARMQEHRKGCGLNCISKFKRRSKAAFSILLLSFNYPCFTGQ